MKDRIDVFANYIFTGCALFMAFIFIGLIVDNLRVVINMTLIIMGVFVLGAVVYELIIFIKNGCTSNKQR